MIEQPSIVLLRSLQTRSANPASLWPNRRGALTAGQQFARPYGLYDRFRSSNEIHWILQVNYRFLENYWRFDVPSLAEDQFNVVHRQRQNSLIMRMTKRSMSPLLNN